MFTRLLEDDFTDVQVTAAGRAYLKAFTRFLAAVRDGDSRAALEAKDARGRALNRLED